MTTSSTYTHVRNIWDFLMVEQIFLSPQVKQNVIIAAIYLTNRQSNYLSVRIFTILIGKKHRQMKLAPALTKSINIGIWVVGTTRYKKLTLYSSVFTRRQMAIFGDNFPTIFDDNFKNICH